MTVAQNISSDLYTAPFSDPDGCHALYVPRTGSSASVAHDPRVSVLLQNGFHHAATHGHCAVMFPADIGKAIAILTNS